MTICDLLKTPNRKRTNKVLHLQIIFLPLVIFTVSLGHSKSFLNKVNTKIIAG